MAKPKKSFDSVHGSLFFHVLFSYDPIEKNFLMLQNSNMIFLILNHIDLEKKYARRYAKVRYYAGNDLKMMTKIRFFVFSCLFALEKTEFDG